MKPSLKKEWLRSLRSGEYQQGTERLVTVTRAGVEKFCCLGVLCDIGLDDDWILGKGLAAGDIPVDAYSIGTATGKPSYRQQDALGLENDAMHDLVRMNDGGASFAEIADWIEENVS